MSQVFWVNDDERQKCAFTTNMSSSTNMGDLYSFHNRYFAPFGWVKSNTVGYNQRKRRGYEIVKPEDVGFVFCANQIETTIVHTQRRFSPVMMIQKTKRRLRK